MTSDLQASFRRSARPLLELFSAVMLLDRDLRIVDASDTLKTYMPGLDAQPLLAEAFEFKRPNSVRDFGEAVNHLRSLFLLEAADGNFAIRGQLLQESYGGQECLVFCGAPWLSWMVLNRPEIRLHLRDFSPQDVQLDQLFYISTEARMVADLERLNAELKVAKEQVESAQSAKDAFFARMSHEMRTPLNGVVSAISLMRDEKVDGKTGELIGLASKSSSNLMQVINYVLDVSKLESEEYEPEEIEFDLPELVGSVSDIVRARALEKGVELRSHCDPRLPGRWLGDVDRLRQALLNLLINAIKFTDSGSVAVQVESVRDENQVIRFEVQDSGVGIPRHQQALVFEAFTTLSGSAEAGTGLGLDIARRNIESMGGKIGVSSAPGVGSTFWMELPLKVVVKDVSLTVTSAGEETPGDSMLFSGKVLLVDDNETNLMLGTMILESMGVTVSQASSGEEAVRMALDSNFDLLLMDISMPGMDGHAATRLIREKRPADKLPVVALTAYASSEEQARSEASGMNGYLTKPIEREKLAEVLSNWLGRIDDAGAFTAGEESEDDQPSLVDMAVLENLERQIGADKLGTAIKKFIEEAGRRWSALEAAADSAGLAREAHSLASTCGSFGLPAVADRLNVIEACARSGATVEPMDIELSGRELMSGLLELQSVFASLHSTPG